MVRLGKYLHFIVLYGELLLHVNVHIYKLLSRLPSLILNIYQY